MLKIVALENQRQIKFPEDYSVTPCSHLVVCQNIMYCCIESDHNQDRYKFMDLLPCNDDELRMLGYNVCTNLAHPQI